MNNFDRTLMLLLNFDGGSVLSAIMTFASSRIAWIPLYLLMGYLLFRWLGWRRAVVSIAFIALGVVAADQLCNLFKVLLPTPRPTHSDLLPQLHNVVKMGGVSGTASSHAANTSFLALFLALTCRRRWLWWVLIPWTLLVSYSRIYLGLHYPFQIAAGIGVGSIIAMLLYLSERLAFKLLPNKS